jgi:SAM-dependent methyltransferase
MQPAPPPSVAENFLRKVRLSLRDGSFRELRLRPEGGDGEDVRRIAKATGPALSLVRHEARRDLTRTLSETEGLDVIAAALVRPGSAWLATAARNWQLVIPARGRGRLVEHKASARAPNGDQHNRAKQHHLGASARDWLQALDLVDERGRPRIGRGDKVRQVERYADLLSHFAADCGWKPGADLQVVDMGCGRGYLTFAAWHLFRRELKMSARVLGVDAQASVVESCRAAARHIHADGLEFQVGAIQDIPLPAPHVLVALHACNVATDHALARGVQSGAQLIVVAPCCHKDLRRVLGAPEPLAPLLEHGLFKEHFAEWLTDGLRVLALEAAGYRVTVAEFVDPEHTPKNTLIAGIRGAPPARRVAAAAQYASLRAWAGLDILPTDELAGSGNGLA